MQGMRKYESNKYIYSNDEQLNLTLFVKAYEDITEYREVIINKEDTTS